MTPKEKAVELVSQYKNLIMDEDTDCGNEPLCTLIAMKSAVIAVDEILLLCPFETYRETLSPYDGAELSTKYWQEVRQEIENL